MNETEQDRTLFLKFGTTEETTVIYGFSVDDTQVVIDVPLVFRTGDAMHIEKTEEGVRFYLARSRSDV